MHAPSLPKPRSRVSPDSENKTFRDRIATECDSPQFGASEGWKARAVTDGGPHAKFGREVVMSSTGIVDRKNPIEELNPELGGKVVKLVADDMQRAKRASEEKKAAKKKRAEEQQKKKG
jgi:hypothetical protein